MKRALFTFGFGTAAEWLDIGRASMQAYAAAQGMEFVDFRTNEKCREKHTFGVYDAVLAFLADHPDVELVGTAKDGCESFALRR